MERFALRNDQWDRIKNILPGREGHVGGTAEDNRRDPDFTEKLAEVLCVYRPSRLGWGARIRT